MKKTLYNSKRIEKKNYFLFLILLQCLFVFNISCGLDYYEVIDPPVRNSTLYYDESDFTQKYFSFESGIKDSSISGTDVYYKIYNSYNTMVSESNSINNYIESDEYKANAYSRMESTYSYKILKVQNSNNSVLIKGDGSSKTVTIRLTDYQDGDAYSAKITVNNEKLGIPLRNDGKSNFNFGRSSIDENSKLPAESDDDVKFTTSTSSSEEENLWYVVLYAVNIKMKADYSLNPSVPCYLGVMKIDSSNEDN